VTRACRILIVEDHKEARALFERRVRWVLRDSQVQVELADDYSTGVAGLERRPDLAIIDIHLGEDSDNKLGKELILDAQQVGVPCIAVTEYGGVNPRDVEDVRLSGALKFFYKREMNWREFTEIVLQVFAGLGGQDNPRAHVPLLGDGSMLGAAAHDVDRPILAAVVLSDLVNSTKLQSECGDHRWAAEVKPAHANRAECLATQHRGRLISYQGDALIAAFESPVEALLFSLDLDQDAGESRLKVRVGVEVGLVRISQNEISGIAVNRASRYADAEEKKSGVRVGEVTRIILNREDSPLLRDTDWILLPEQDLKGMEGEHRVWRVRRKPVTFA
jgi:class 3 adenylate cyclase/CheY-like chemotaxis protein